MIFNKRGTIEHWGRVEELTPKEVIVSIISQSACASCHAKGVCSASDIEEKRITVRRVNNESYSIGETVKVSLKQSMGYKALLLGYLLPLVVLLVSLFTLSGLGFSEAESGLYSLLLLLPYYGIIYLFRNRISREFNFEIAKIN